MKHIGADLNEHLQCEDDGEDVVGDGQEVAFLCAQQTNSLRNVHARSLHCDPKNASLSWQIVSISCILFRRTNGIFGRPVRPP